MSHRLNQPLAREIVLSQTSPRTLDTLLSAIEFLNSARNDADPEIDVLLSDIMAAGTSGEAEQVEAVTERIESLLRQHGQL